MAPLGCGRKNNDNKKQCKVEAAMCCASMRSSQKMAGPRMQARKGGWILLICLINFLTSAQALLQCNSFFTQTGRLTGLIKIRPPYNSTVINVDAEFIVNEVIQTNYYGLMKLAENDNGLASRLRSNDFRDIVYQVEFPEISKAPYLNKLIVNDKTLCEVRQQALRPYSRFNLRHEWFTSLQLVLDNLYENGPQQYQNPYTPPAVQPVRTEAACPPPPRCSCPAPIVCPRPQKCPEVQCPPARLCPAPAPPPRCSCPAPTSCPQPQKCQASGTTLTKIENDDKFKRCGVSPSRLVTNLIHGGKEVAKGQYPWVAAIFHTSQMGIEFKCSGTLISEIHVVTAGHCVINEYKDGVKGAQDVFVFLNRYQLFDFHDEAIAPEISKITTHPYYDMQAQAPVADLAIIRFKHKVTFGPFVKPICLWNPQKSFPSTGKIVGWGSHDYGPVSKRPKEAEVNVIDSNACEKYEGVETILSNHTLCAISVQSRTGGSPCYGDSGGGLYIKANGGLWYLRGVVSQTLLNKKNNCDETKPSTYADISTVLQWIKDEIRLSGISLPLE
ncbi:transmembrane protease serine 9-like [Cloeon dipterum]|uniref:transmembrane protease serine 9-like n=1 Tax=Cloeon dipterum TaxID=197152 RepID=UPI00321F6496